MSTADFLPYEQEDYSLIKGRAEYHREQYRMAEKRAVPAFLVGFLFCVAKHPEIAVPFFAFGLMNLYCMLKEKELSSFSAAAEELGKEKKLSETKDPLVGKGGMPYHPRFLDKTGGHHAVYKNNR